MMTLNQLIILYKDIATRHEMVNDFAAVQDFNIGADDAPTYPILVVNPTSANLPRTENGYTSFTTTFDLQIIDLVNKDNDNRMDVLSDTMQTINDVVNEFNTHPYYIDSGLDTIGDVSFAPLRGVYADDVDGWKVSMQLEHPNKLSFCGNPIENLSGFDFTPASVTVVDGLNTYDLFPSDSYTCEATVINVSNSDDSYSVDTEVSLELPNINFTDSDGITTSVPSMEDVVCTPLVVSDWLEIKVDTRIAGNSLSNEFQLPAFIDLTIDKGDGSDILYTTGGTPNVYLLQYAVGGIYTVKLKIASFSGGSFSADKFKITSVENWGTQPFNASFNAFFDGCTNMVVNATDTLLFASTALTSTFRNCILVTGVEKLTTDYATTVQSMYQGTSLNANLGGYDLRRCTNFSNFAVNVVTWSTESYGLTLMGWLRWDSVTHAPAVGWVMKSNEAFNGGTSTLAIGSEAALARQYYIDVLGWSFVDGGLV